MGYDSYSSLGVPILNRLPGPSDHWKGAKWRRYEGCQFYKVGP